MDWLPWRIKNCGMNCLHLIKRSRKCFVYFSSFLVSHSLEITISLSDTFFLNDIASQKVGFGLKNRQLCLYLRIWFWVEPFIQNFTENQDRKSRLFLFALRGWWRHSRVPLALSLTWKNVNRKLQFCIFTLPGFQILARRSLFSAAMLFFCRSQSTSILSPKKQWSFIYSSSII